MDDSKEIIETRLTLNQDVHPGIPGSCECTTSDFALQCLNSSSASRIRHLPFFSFGHAGKCHPDAFEFLSSWNVAPD
jgi:hypothetical protein